MIKLKEKKKMLNDVRNIAQIPFTFHWHLHTSKYKEGVCGILTTADKSPSRKEAILSAMADLKVTIESIGKMLYFN